MRLYVASDLHLDHQPDWQLPVRLPPFDVGVFAGDIHGSCPHSVGVLRDAPALQGKPVVFVPGNHEFYALILQDDQADGRHAAAGTNVRLLSCDAVEIGGVRFLGCTLWTDYRLDGTPKPSMVVAGQSLNDHRLIRFRERGDVDHIARFMPWHAAMLHREELAFLVKHLEKPFPGPTVVVTHHLPSPRSIAPKFQGSPLNAAFASDLDWLIERFQPELWIHGHSHHACDYGIGKTRVLSNPKGYGPHRIRGQIVENSAFDPGLVVEI